jgi:hypothetical protein
MRAVDVFLRGLDGEFAERLGAWILVERNTATEGVYDVTIEYDGVHEERFVIEVRPAEEVADAQP